MDNEQFVSYHRFYIQLEAQSTLPDTVGRNSLLMWVLAQYCYPNAWGGETLLLKGDIQRGDRAKESLDLKVFKLFHSSFRFIFFPSLHLFWMVSINVFEFTNLFFFSDYSAANLIQCIFHLRHCIHLLKCDLGLFSIFCIS